MVNAGQASGAMRRADEKEVAAGLEDGEPRGPKTTAIDGDEDVAIEGGDVVKSSAVGPGNSVCVLNPKPCRQNHKARTLTLLAQCQQHCGGGILQGGCLYKDGEKGLFGIFMMRGKGSLSISITGIDLPRPRPRSRWLIRPTSRVQL